MPLVLGSSRAAIGENIRRLRHEGYPQRQSMAIALRHARRARRRNPRRGDDTLILLLLGGFLLWKAGLLDTLLTRANAPTSSPSRLPPAGATPRPAPLPAGGMLVNDAPDGGFPVLQVGAGTIFRPPPPPLAPSQRPSPFGPGGAAIGQPPLQSQPAAPAIQSPVIVAPNIPGQSAQLTALVTANRNIVQQIAEWQWRGKAEGRAPCDWGELRQHVMRLGAPDPGPTAPPEFTAACRAVLTPLGSQIAAVQGAWQRVLTAYDGVWRIQPLGDGRTAYQLVINDPATQALAEVSVALRQAVTALSATGDASSVAALSATFADAASAVWRIQPLGDGHTLLQMVAGDPATQALASAWTAYISALDALRRATAAAVSV